jgi:hypothetical protein
MSISKPFSIISAHRKAVVSFLYHPDWGRKQLLPIIPGLEQHEHDVVHVRAGWSSVDQIATGL